MADDNPKAVWLSAQKHKPQGGMILWRYPNETTSHGGWRLAIAYLAKGGHYVDCGGAAGGDLADMTHFMEIPE